MDFCQDQSRLPGCQAPVPPELEVERLCVLHFIQAVEQACTDMRREAARGWASPARQSEIANYIKTAATKLSCVTTGGLRLSDELKKRVLTALLTLMVLSESLDRCASPYVPELPAPSLSGAPTNIRSFASSARI
jgi:hypothetical protein